MNEPYIFLSVGGVANDAQELFVKAIEDRIASEGLIPKTVGRNTFSEESPLKTINKLMADCSGTIIIALERTYFPEGVEKRGGDMEKILRDVKFPTPWNQIEAAMAYSKGQPLMIIMEEDLKKEGLLDTGQEWFILLVKPDASSLNTPAFNGVLASWKGKVAELGISPKVAIRSAFKLTLNSALN
ncbi:hypothetical protein [Pedobacter caeni]|uniref:Nucleoside 2-deoxyribosyltransferase n=1 Tax=Pedobacter caeni TaxID=288992 RepID=A0A1M4VC13_9SPHI|nr:hypothetical protein [Pedobacter caeni]SHE66477.1 hypothetical protein SAMN04488522_101856 [Pedobacter caeni]